MNELERYVQLLTLVLCDEVPDEPLPAYLVGETADNQGSVFRRLIDRYESSAAFPVAFTGGVTTGYPGADAWMRELVGGYGVDRERIHVIPLERQLNTLTEMEALVDYAHAQRWDRLVLIAAPFHQLRSFLTIVGAMRRRQLTYLKVYNLPGIPLPWQAQALHSQGQLKATREGLIGAELERIGRYTAKGDLATVDEALEYLRQRDV